MRGEQGVETEKVPVENHIKYSTERDILTIHSHALGSR